MLNVVRRDFTGPIDISVAGPAHVTGATTIAAGQNAAMLLVTAAADAPVGGHRLNLIAKATINNKPVVEAANVEAIVKTALNNTPFPPKSLSNDLAVAVTEKTPFSFQIKYDTAEGVRGLSVPVTITATKAMGFDEEITITTQTLPPAQGQQPPLPAATAKIAKGQKEVKLELKPAANAPLGAVPIGFVAKAKVGAKEYTTVAPLTPLTLALPFELQVNTQGGKFTADSKHKIKVTAVRKGGYKGPIGLEVRNLPANVTAAKVNIAENTNEIEIELSAAANATVGDKADVNILGTATGAANQTNASANFTLSVGKKP
jgi:hypothetical protein